MSGRTTGRSLALRLAAELGVIVLGVWIALWADGWAADRNGRRTEAARLEALGENIQQTRTVLAEEYDATLGAAEALQALTAVDDETLSRDRAAVGRRFLLGFFHVPAFTPELNVYEDLRSSGELGLLTDPELRQALSAMDATFELLAAAQEDLATVQQLNVDPYLRERIDLRPCLGFYLELPDAGDPAEADLGFLTSREARNLALFKLDLMVQVAEAMTRADSASRRVAERIESGHSPSR